MALIKCDDCGREVSDRASTCPQCGAPVAQQTTASSEAPVSIDPKSHARVTRTGAKWEGIGFLLIAGGLIALFGGAAQLGGIAMAVGFVVFLVGRFK